MNRYDLVFKIRCAGRIVAKIALMELSIEAMRLRWIFCVCLRRRTRTAVAESLTQQRQLELSNKSVRIYVPILEETFSD
jgi:hypothetical protein